MKTKGFDLIGTGAFGVVLEHPTYPWVFKIFRHDSAYLTYFKIAVKNQHNPYVLKIKGNFIKINENTYCVRLEKLAYAEKVSHLIEIFGEFSLLRKNIGYIIYYTRVQQIIKKNAPELVKEITENSLTSSEIAALVYQRFPKEIDDLNEIFAIILSIGFTPDMDDQNIMKRPSDKNELFGSQYVFIDPVFDKKMKT